jgi:hypothetical protein
MKSNFKYNIIDYFNLKEPLYSFSLDLFLSELAIYEKMKKIKLNKKFISIDKYTEIQKNHKNLIDIFMNFDIRLEKNKFYIKRRRFLFENNLY